MKKGSFTVEAAVIVPFTIAVIALLIGYCYFVHQINWCKGAAYEAAFCGIERTVSSSEAASKAESRMNQRISEAPLAVGSISADVSADSSVEVSFSSSVIQEYFGDLFDLGGEAKVLRVDAMNYKRLEFIMKGLTG